MHSRLIALVLCCTFLGSCKKDATKEALIAFSGVIPKPLKSESHGGAFFLTAETSIVCDDDAEVARIGQYLKSKLNPATGFDFPQTTSEYPSSNYIQLTLKGGSPDLGQEGYDLSITTDGVKLTANNAAGLFRGVQTIRQILPDKIELSSAQNIPWEMATGHLFDFPAYPWRGAMLDVARHFFEVEDVKRTVDLIAYYKMNTLHLHLSDDQGWRIEIKSWPNLALHGGSTQVGGGKAGYYTQEQFKEIVAYAQSRYITIIPEIELPGHINAALASYGELNGGTVVPIEGRVVSPVANPVILDGKNKPTELYKGIDVGWSTLRLEKPATFKFVNDVLRELAALTPGPYLHIGGDEAWVTKKEDYIQFINRFKSIIEANGKHMVGWEEIGQAEVDSQVIAQFWKDRNYAMQAAEKGARILFSPSKKIYLDMKYDSTSKFGSDWAAFIEIDDAYNWDPLSELEGIEPHQVAGIEAPLWSEFLTTMDDVEFMLFPRLPGIAEVAWTPVASRSWTEYKVRLAHQGTRMKAMGIDFYKSKRVPWEGE